MFGWEDEHVTGPSDSLLVATTVDIHKITIDLRLWYNGTGHLRTRRLSYGCFRLAGPPPNAILLLPTTYIAGHNHHERLVPRLLFVCGALRCRPRFPPWGGVLLPSFATLCDGAKAGCVIVLCSLAWAYDIFSGELLVILLFGNQFPFCATS